MRGLLRDTCALFQPPCPQSICAEYFGASRYPPESPGTASGKHKSRIIGSAASKTWFHDSVLFPSQALTGPHCRLSTADCCRHCRLSRMVETDPLCVVARRTAVSLSRVCLGGALPFLYPGFLWVSIVGNLSPDNTNPA
jgi:hypothetical protein